MDEFEFIAAAQAQTIQSAPLSESAALAIFASVIALLMGIVGWLIVRHIDAKEKAADEAREALVISVKEHFDKLASDAKESRLEIARRIDERDATMNRRHDERDEMMSRRLDAQDKVLEAVRKAQEDARQTQFEEVMAIRDLHHQHDKRIDRLEQEDARRSRQVRQGDYT